MHGLSNCPLVSHSVLLGENKVHICLLMQPNYVIFFSCLVKLKPEYFLDAFKDNTKQNDEDITEVNMWK